MNEQEVVEFKLESELNSYLSHLRLFTVKTVLEHNNITFYDLTHSTSSFFFLFSLIKPSNQFFIFQSTFCSVVLVNYMYHFGETYIILKTVLVFAYNSCKNYSSAHSQG